MANYVNFKQGFEKDFNTTNQPLTNGMVYFVIDDNNRGSIYYDTMLDGTTNNKNGAVRRVKFSGLPTIEILGSVKSSSSTISTDGSKITINTVTNHTHGLIHQNFNWTLTNDSSNTAWTRLDSNGNQGFWLKSIRGQANAPAWFLGNYAAGIAFGGSDTKGVISAAYNSPQIRFAGGNGTAPVWNITVTGTSGKTYDLNKLGANASSADKLSHNITFKINPTANQTNGETGVTTDLSGTAINLTLCAKLSGFENIQSTRFQGNADSATYAGYAQSLYLNPTSRQTSLNYSMSNSNYNKKVTYSLASSSTTTGKPTIGDAGVLTFGWDTTTGWGAQLAININKGAHLAVRGASDSSGSSDWGSWATVLDSSNYTSYINNYYWANVKVSTAASETTKPTFGGLTTSGWIYSSALNLGWMNSAGGGGIYMTDTTWLRVYGGKKFYVSNTSTDAIYTTGGVKAALGFTADGTMTIHPYSNEINFGGTNTSTSVYFGYRAKDSRPIPTVYVFGSSSAGTARIQAASATFGYMYLSDSNWIGWYGTKANTGSTRYGYIQNDIASNGVMKFVREQGGYFTFNGNVLPSASGSYSLGTSSYVWNTLHVNNLNLYGQTANRLVWTNGSKALQAGYHYADTTKVAVNTTTAPGYNFYVTGTSRFTGTVEMNSLTTHHNHLTLDTGYTIYSPRNGSSWNTSHTNAFIRITGSDTGGAWFPLFAQATTNGYWTGGYYPNMADDYQIGYYPKSYITDGTNYFSFRLRLRTTLSGDYMPLLATYNTAVGGSYKPIYIDTNGKAQACTYTLQATVNASGAANRMTYYSGTNALSPASAIYTNGSYLAIGADNSNYKLYVSGVSFFNGNTTHNGVVYFANGTTYYINNNADARFRYVGVGTAGSNTSYALNVGGIMNVVGNAIHTGHVYPSATTTYDLGTTSLKWRNLYIQNITLSGQTANRLMWTNSSLAVQAANHYAAADRIAVNYTSAPGYNFYVGGSSYLNGSTTINGNTAITNGVLTLAKGRYTGPSGSYGMNANNSDIIGLNGIFTADLAENFGEGYNFWRSSSSTYDAMAAANGVFYFGSNVAYGAALTGSATLDAGRGLFRTNVTIGQTSLNGSYALYVNGTSYFTNTMNFANNIGIKGIMGGGSDYWGIIGTGTGDAGRLKIYVSDNATTDWLDFEFRDYTGTIYTPLSMTGNQIKIASNVYVGTNNTYTLGTSGARWAKVYIGGADSYGSGTKPIYWSNGVPTACSFGLNATINSGTANRMAYYSSASAISAASSIYASNTNLGVNGDPGGYTFYVNGNSYFQGLARVYKYLQVIGNQSTDDSTYLRFMASDITERATIAWNGNTDGAANLKIKTVYGYINLHSAVGTIYLNGKKAFIVSDSWLRINEGLGFSSGIYTGTSLLRSDNQLQVGNSGSAFYANSSGNGYFSNSLGIGGKNTTYKLYVSGTSYLTSNVGIGGYTDSYRLYVNGNTLLNGIVGINGYNSNYKLYINGEAYATGYLRSAAGLVINRTSAENGIYLQTNGTPVARIWPHAIGTTSAVGATYMQIGNSTASGTANNAQGILRLYGTSSGYVDIRPGTHTTTSYTLYLPGASGQFVYHTNDTAIGSGTKPVYITAAGQAVASTSTVGSSTVPVYLNAGTLTAISSYSGNSATATKLKTARNISLGSLLRGSASFDGSSNITINASNYSCTVSGGNTANYPWRRIGYITGVSGTYNDKTILLRIRHTYNGGGEGLVKIALRTNSSGSAVDIQAQWLYRYNITVDNIAIASYGVTGNSVYADIFYKTSTWPRCVVENVSNSYNFTLVNSNEVNNTTATDKLTSTESYASIAAAGTELHSQAYTTIVYGVNTPTDKMTARTITIGNKSLSFDGTANLTYTLSAIGAVNRAGDTMTGNLYGSVFLAKQASTENQVGVSYNSGTLYLSGNNSTGLAALYDSNYGFILKRDTSNSGYYLTATQATLSRGMNSESTVYYGINSLQYFNTATSTTSGATVVANPTSEWYYHIRMNHANNLGYYGDQAWSFHSNNAYYRRIVNGSDQGWVRIWLQGNAVTGAVWNDYAECRQSDFNEPGYVMFEKGDDTLEKTYTRLQPFAGVISDTWGFSQGETEKAKTNIAVAGRVLVYPYQNRNNYKPGDCVCSAPNGTVDIMTREEVIQYPDRIVGTVSCVPDYEEWGGGKHADRDPVKVNGRIWIKVR